MEKTSDWRGFLMASAYVIEAKKVSEPLEILAEIIGYTLGNIPGADASSGQMVSVRPEAMTLSFLRSAAASEQTHATVTISPAKEGYQLGDIYKKRLCEGQKYRAENPATCSRFD